MLLLLIASCVMAVSYGQIPGGWTDTTVSVTDEPVLFAVQAIKNTFSSNGGSSLTLSNVVTAQSQVVAGQNLKLSLKMSNDMVCSVTVWYRAWLHTAEKLQVTDGPHCAMARKRSSLLGGVTSTANHIDQNTDSGVTGALSFISCAYNDQSNSMNAMMIKDYSSITYTQQLTAGMTYKFSNVPLVESTCRYTGCAATTALLLTSPNHCQAQQNSNLAVTCSFTIQYQAWMTPQYAMTNMQC